MSTIQEVAADIGNGQPIPEPYLENLILLSDVSNHKKFFSGDNAKDAVKTIANLFVTQYFNHPDPNVVPIRRKTKFVLVLNNFALNKALRAIVLDALKNMDSIFEESMKKEGAMPFDSELGRMSEHVLVLLMRVCNYKLKAAQVNEFAEFNTQFAVQLLLAILLKEPPYEFELRCNCISGLLGFTQPQAFFQATDKIELQSCEKFSEKVDFIANLMLRLQAVTVVNDVITSNMIESPTVNKITHVAICNMMRCIMNIFQFVSKGASQWRQHVLLSTSFVDNACLLYLQLQTKALENQLTVSLSSAAPQLAPELVPGISLALKFMAFATFHMGRHAQCLRPLCAFVHDLLRLPVRLCLRDERQVTQIASLYAQLFHLLANMDGLGSDEGIVESPEDLLPELSAAELRKTITGFLKAEVAPTGHFQVFYSKFASVDSDALVAQDCVTFQTIEAIFSDVKSTAAASSAAAAAPVATSQQQPPAAAPSDSKSLLGDVPTISKPTAEKKAPPPSQPVEIKQNFVAPKAKPTTTGGSGGSSSKYACALNGHTMKVPVTSPYGHTFEKETIDQWIKQQGPVCPITGKPLHIEDLKPNKELQNEIMQTIIQQSFNMVNQEDEMDLYDF
jgi:hypothetical protein